MAEAKKEAKKVVKKVIKKGKLKITKSNGRVIYREDLEGVKESYIAKGFKVEEE
tara:strand:- start:1456 stop:1617 length:162 start_codon:yes stop_codon:yes gene_type:complete